METVFPELPAAAGLLPPLRAAVLVGGSSRRMGEPKEGLRIGSERLLDRILEALRAAGPDPVVLIGAGAAVAGAAAKLPRLPDVPGVEGPVAGLLAALRSEPSAWLIAACDLPRLTASAVAWLVKERRADRWAVMPCVGGRVQPLLAVYEPEAVALLEQLAAEGTPSPSRLEGHPRVWSPQPPSPIAPAWRGVNTREELALYERERESEGQDERERESEGRDERERV